MLAISVLEDDVEEKSKARNKARIAAIGKKFHDHLPEIETELISDFRYYCYSVTVASWQVTHLTFTVSCLSNEEASMNRNPN